MKLVYDTETTGIPEFGKPSEDPCQPHIMQIAGILIDDSWVEKLRINLYIKPDGWVVPEAVTAMTGLTQIFLECAGVPIGAAMDSFLSLWKMSEGLIGHNESFDRRMLRIELARIYGKQHVMLEDWKSFPGTCTMQKSRKAMRLGKNKVPKLEEAHEFFCGRRPEKIHDAMADAESTLAVYRRIALPMMVAA